MTDGEMQTIVAEVLRKIREYSVRVVDLADVGSLPADSFIELSGGYKVRVNDLVTAARMMNIITTNDSTQPSNENVYSALKSDSLYFKLSDAFTQFLRKDADDSDPNKITLGDLDLVKWTRSDGSRSTGSIDAEGDINAGGQVHVGHDLLLGLASMIEEAVERKILSTFGAIDSLTDGVGTFVTNKDRLQTGDIEARGDMKVMGDSTVGSSMEDTAIFNAVMKVVNQIQSNQYTDDSPFSKGFRIQSSDDGGFSYMVIDKLFVRLKAIFNELEIRKLSYVGGNMILSHAGSEIVKVVALTTQTAVTVEGGVLKYNSPDVRVRGEVLEIDNPNVTVDANGKMNIPQQAYTYAYRCYIKKDDGTTATENWWRVDDQAKCQTFNVVEPGHYQNVENRYFWRRVINTGTEKITLEEGQTEENYDYIDLSAVDCDSGSDIPVAGDRVVQMGNRTDVNRQGFISLEVYSTDGSAPSFQVFKNVNSYSTVNKRKIIISPKNTELMVNKFKIETDYGTFPQTKERGDWDDIPDHKCYYYDIAQHSGASWLCIYPEEGIGGVMYTTEEPGDNATYWRVYARAGKDGEDGKSFNIKGAYDTVEEFEQAAIVGDEGEAYVVAGHLYIWDPTNNRWKDVGQFKGDTGNGVASASVAYNVTSSISVIPSTGWAESPSSIAVSPGTYLITRIILNYTDGTSSAPSYTFARQGVDGAYVATAFCRTNKTITGTPTGGTYQNPVPNQQTVQGETVTWSDGIPATDANGNTWAVVWATSNRFYADGTSAGWTAPRPMTDTADYDVEFAKKQAGDAEPPAPTDANRHGGSGTQIWFDPVQDSSEDFTKMYWRAERKSKNGVWGDWTVERIKGEKGDQGDQGHTTQLLASPSFIAIKTDADGYVIDDFEKEVELTLYVSGQEASLSSVTINESGTSYITPLMELIAHPWAGATVNNGVLNVPEGSVVNGILRLSGDDYAVVAKKLLVKVSAGTLLVENDIVVSAEGLIALGESYEGADIIRIQRQYWSQKSQFTSMVFKRSASRPETPTGGTYDSPVPEGWEDGIPSGTGIVWASTCVFHGDGTTSGWSEPQAQIDTEDNDIEFSPSTTRPVAPVGDPFVNREAQGWYDPTSPNFDTAGTMIWRAERKVKNGAWETGGDWVVSRIYGEKGDTGAAGAAAVDVSISSQSVIFRQSETEAAGGGYPIIFENNNNKTTIKIVRGGSEIPISQATSVSLNTVHCNASRSGSVVTISSIHTYTQSGQSYYYDNGYVDISVVYGGVTYVCRFNFYCNLLGTWKDKIEGDTNTAIAEKIEYLYDPENPNQVVKNSTYGQFVQSSTQATSRLQQEVEDPTTGLIKKYSDISQTVNGISMKVGESGNVLYNAYFDELIATLVLGASSTTSIHLVSASGEGESGGYGSYNLSMGGGYFNTRLRSSMMGTDGIGYGVFLPAGTYTFQAVLRVTSEITASGAYCALHLVWDDRQDMSGFNIYRSPLASFYVNHTDYRTHTQTFTLTEAKYVAFFMEIFGLTQGGTGFSFRCSAVKLEMSATASGMSRTSDYSGNRVSGVSDIKNGLLATGIDIEKGKITNTADRWECQNNSGQKTAWLDNLGNFTVRGVYNNLITVITQGNWTNYIIKQDNKYYLDVLRVGYYVRINSLPSEMQEQKIQLPYYGNSGSAYKCRGYTRYDTGEVHQMSADELKMLAGKRIVIDINFENSSFLYTSIGDTWYPHVYYGSNSPTDYQKEQVMRATMNGRRRYLTLTNDTMNIRKTFTLGVKNTIFLEMALVQFHASQTDSSFSYGYIWLGDADTSAASHDDIDW